MNDLIETRLQQVQDTTKNAKIRLENMRDAIKALREKMEKEYGGEYTGCEIRMRQVRPQEKAGFLVLKQCLSSLKRCLSLRSRRCTPRCASGCIVRYR